MNIGACQLVTVKWLLSQANLLAKGSGHFVVLKLHLTACTIGMQSVTMERGVLNEGVLQQAVHQ